jgi:hypothetical protein
MPKLQKPRILTTIPIPAGFAPAFMRIFPSVRYIVPHCRTVPFQNAQRNRTLPENFVFSEVLPVPGNWSIL